MTRHLQAESASATQPAGRSFHLFVEARYDKGYWMHLAVPVEAPLRKVDAFLRGIWLECCGHLSAFTIDDRRYASAPMQDAGESGMAVPLGRVLTPGMVFSYEYDYGSTTELTLKIFGLRDRAAGPSAVELLARNDTP